MTLTTASRAYIHHKDGNSVNNPANGSNWMVLCPKCHHEYHREKVAYHTGFYIVVIFQTKLRERILQNAGYKCQRCGCSVQPTNQPTNACSYCGYSTNRKRIVWTNGKIMCRSCFEEWARMGSPKVFQPTRKRLRWELQRKIKGDD